jgi:hypothetical protein
MSSIDEDGSAERQPATPRKRKRKRKRWSTPRVILSEVALSQGGTYHSVEGLHPTLAFS